MNLNWANVLTREARGLIASAMLQSVAHRARTPTMRSRTGAGSRHGHVAHGGHDDEAASDDDHFVSGSMRDIEDALRPEGAGRDHGPARLDKGATESTGNAALDDAIADIPDRGLADGDDGIVHVIGIFSTDSMIQRIGLREMFNREAQWFFVARGGDVPALPRFYRWQWGRAEDIDDRPAPALPDCARPVDLDAGVWHALAHEGLLNARCRAWLGGSFTSVSAQAVSTEMRRRGAPVLRLRLVGHGATVDAEGRHPLRCFANTPAAIFATHLSTTVLPVCAPPDALPAQVRIDFVACALAVPGESATSHDSYLGSFLRSLNEQDRSAALMSRVRVSAGSHVLTFLPFSFTKCREIVIAGLMLTFTREQLREFGLASIVTVVWDGHAPRHRDDDAPQLSRRERVLLGAYAAAWADWERKGRRWRKKEVPSRFVLLDNLLDTAVRLEDRDDIAVFRTFIEGVSPGALGVPSSTPSPDATTRMGRLRSAWGAAWGAGVTQSRATTTQGRKLLRTVSLDYGAWRAHYSDAGLPNRATDLSALAERPEAARAVPARLAAPHSGSLEGCAVSLALALQKIMTSRACLAQLSKARQKALRRYYLTPWRLVDEAVFRRIGLPANGTEFVDRWKALASTSRPTRMGGEVLHGLVTIGSTHDARVARRILDLALYQGTFARLADPDRQAFLSGDGAVVYYGDARACGDVADRVAFSDAAGGAVGAQLPRDAHRPAPSRAGWHVHAFDNGRPVCRALDDAAAWEGALGALGRIVAKQAGDVLREIDAIRMRLVKNIVAEHLPSRDGAARSAVATSDVDSGNDTEAADAIPYLAASPSRATGSPGALRHGVAGPSATAFAHVAHRGRADDDTGLLTPIWRPWCDARARRTVADERHGCNADDRPSTPIR